MLLQKLPEVDLRPMVPCLPGLPLVCFPTGVLLFQCVALAQHWRQYNAQGGLPSITWPCGAYKTGKSLGRLLPYV